ncbi:MAG: universal stress protein [Nitrososphaerales archaeon]|jgi:nucleotide-binding universal stress UspA family protein
MLEKKAAVEWSWSDAPVVLPLAYQPHEWNAIFIAFYIAEYSDSKVYVTHVLEGEEDHDFEESLRKEIADLAADLSVKYEFVEVRPKSQPPSVDEIAKALVATAEEKNAQAIVMSAHREPLFRERFGRVSDHVGRTARTRVVLVETPHEGVSIPRNPKHILVPVLKEQHPDPYIIAAALTSSASVADVEITAAKIIELPPTVPLDAVDIVHSLRKEEKEFSYFTSLAIKTLGRFINPKILPVREVGGDVARFVRDESIDIMVIFSRRETGFHSFLTKDEYDIVSRSLCVVIVTLPGA